MGWKLIDVVQTPPKTKSISCASIFVKRELVLDTTTTHTQKQTRAEVHNERREGKGEAGEALTWIASYLHVYTYTHGPTDFGN